MRDRLDYNLSLQASQAAAPSHRLSDPGAARPLPSPAPDTEGMRAMWPEKVLRKGGWQGRGLRGQEGPEVWVQGERCPGDRGCVSSHLGVTQAAGHGPRYVGPGEPPALQPQDPGFRPEPSTFSFGPLISRSVCLGVSLSPPSNRELNAGEVRPHPGVSELGVLPPRQEGHVPQATTLPHASLSPGPLQ